MLWAQLMAKLMYIGYNSIGDPRYPGLSSWLNPSILGLVAYHTYDSLSLAHG